MWFIPSLQEGNTNNHLSNSSSFYRKKYQSNNKCDIFLQKQVYNLERPQRALNFDPSSTTNKPYSFVLMHHLRTKIRRKSSKYTFSSSSNGHTGNADSIIHAGHGRRRAIGAGDRAASERVDWDFVAFPPPSNSTSNSASVSTSSHNSSNNNQQQPHHYQQYKFGGGITGAGIAEEKPIVFHWDEPETYQNHHVQPQLHPRGGGARSQVACSQPLSEYPFEQQNFGFTLGEDPLPPPVPPRLPTKPPPLPPTSSSLRRSYQHPVHSSNGIGYHYPHHPGGYERCKNVDSEQHIISSTSRPTSLYARIQPSRQNITSYSANNSTEVYPSNAGEYIFFRKDSGRSSRKRPRSSGHSPCSVGSDSPPTPGQRITSRPPHPPPHQYHYRQQSHQEPRLHREYYYHRQSNSDIGIQVENNDDIRDLRYLDHGYRFLDEHHEAPAIPKHMHGSGVPMALPLSPPAPPPPPHASPNPVISPIALNTNNYQHHPQELIAYNQYHRPGTLLRDIDASLRRTLDSPFYRRPQSLACSSVGFGGTGISNQMAHPSRASTVNSMKTEGRTFGSTSRASISRAESLGSSRSLPQRPNSPVPTESPPRRILSPGILSPSPPIPRRSWTGIFTYQPHHHPYDEVPTPARGKISISLETFSCAENVTCPTSYNSYLIIRQHFFTYTFIH